MLDVGKNTSFKNLFCDRNQLTCLDLHNNVNIEHLSVTDQIVNVDIGESYIIDLTQLNPCIDASKITYIEGGILNGNTITEVGAYIYYLYDTDSIEALGVHITIAGREQYPGNENIQIVEWDWADDNLSMDIGFDLYLKEVLQCNLFTAIYDGDNRLIGISLETATFADNYAYVPTRVYYTGEPYVIKVFLWKNTTIIRPLANPLEIHFYV